LSRAASRTRRDHGYVRDVAEEASPARERIRLAEVIAAMSLATDLSIGVPLEHGLYSTLLAMRLADRLKVDADTATQTYYACQLFYVGCTADADVAAELFGADDALTAYATGSRFGSRAEMAAGMLRAIAPPGGGPMLRTRQLATGIPKVAGVFRHHVAAFCEVAAMLTDRLGAPPSVGPLFAHVAERWDGTGEPGRVRRDGIPLPIRIVHVARDAAFQRMLGGTGYAAAVVRRRAGHAFDPDVVGALIDEALGGGTDAAAWDETLAREPRPYTYLEGESIDRALAAMADFSDLVSPHLVGHSTGVAALAGNAAQRCRFDTADATMIRRAALIHDLGRVAVPTRIWQQPGTLSPGDWEKARLHPYHTERILHRSPFLATLAGIAGAHHERCDGSGYHRGTASAGLTPAARLLAAADTYQTKIEPRPHREPLTPGRAAEMLAGEVRAGRLDAAAVEAVLGAAGQPTPRVERPAGLTRREADVIGLLARGFQTKQIARALGISAKTADNHIQNAYGKIGVSTRAAATLFAMQHGLVR
jgi:HD-GYP domain-containing protein (c-di-GMP phosphodiesterase class II)